MTANPGVEVTHLGGGEGVIEAQHGERMEHRAECLQRCGPDALCGGVRPDQIGKRCFQFLQAAHQLVVLGVSDLRIIEDVIAIAMMMKLVVQLLDLSLGLLALHTLSLSKQAPNLIPLSSTV